MYNLLSLLRNHLNHQHHPYAVQRRSYAAPSSTSLSTCTCCPMTSLSS